MSYLKKRLKKGFTLIELLVVLLIIGVLAAIAYPIYSKTITKARAAEAINLLEMVRKKQLGYFARRATYYQDFNAMGAVTTNASQERIGESPTTLKINNYTLTMNNHDQCVRVNYKKGNTDFTFSSSYSKAGLGCSGSVCTTFGNRISDLDTVCNCGSVQCEAGFELETATCSCRCNLPCQENGKCSNKAQIQETERACPGGGVQTRECTANCNGGTCGSWSQCATIPCDSSSKPESTQEFGNCGEQTRTVTCNEQTGQWDIGEWVETRGQGDCSPGDVLTCVGSSGFTGGVRTCTESCEWNFSRCCSASAVRGSCLAQGKYYDNSNLGPGNPCGDCVSCPEYRDTMSPVNGVWTGRDVNLRFDGTSCEPSCKMLDGTWKKWEDTGYSYGLIVPGTGGIENKVYPPKNVYYNLCPEFPAYQCPYPRRNRNGDLLPSTCAFGMEKKPDTIAHCTGRAYYILNEYCGKVGQIACTADYLCAPEVTDEAMVGLGDLEDPLGTRL
jgi:type IV pilus assembly protein PilE